MNPDDPADLLHKKHMADLHHAYAEEFVEYILDEATDHGYFDGDQSADAFIDLLNEMRAEGFRPWAPGEEIQVEAFAGPDAHCAIRDGYDLPIDPDRGVDEIKIQDVTVRLDPSLPNDRLLAVHLNGIVPAPPSSWKSWIVRSPEAVRTVRIPDGRGP